MRENEKCNARLQRHYAFTHDKAVVLSCFRCQPDKPITISPDAEITRATTTPRPELVKGRLTTIASKESAESAEAPAAPEASNNKVDDAPKKVVSPPAMAPTAEGKSETSENAAQEPEAAKPVEGEKTESDKSGEKAESAESGEAVSSKDSKTESTQAKKTEKPSEGKSAETEHATTPSASSNSVGKTVSLGKVTSGPVSFGGCLITFQADYLSARPSEFKSEFELNLNTETPEICATRCYQDGCTGALYLPNNGTCVLGYGDKHNCNKRPLINFLSLNNAKNHESIWIHCTSCRSGKYGATGSVTGNMENNKVEMGEQLADGGKIAEASKAPEVEASTAKASEEKTTATPKAAEATTADKSSEEEESKKEKPAEGAEKSIEKTTAKAPEKSGEEKSTEAAATSASEATTAKAAETKATEAPKAAETTKADKSSEEKDESKAAEATTTTAKTAQAPASSDAEQPCLITFQAGDLSQRPKEFTSEFELNLHTETPEVCATRCFQDGCTGALFFPKNGTCVLGYGDKQFCDKSPILRFYKQSEKEVHKDSIWIHCTVCRKFELTFPRN